MVNQNDREKIPRKLLQYNRHALFEAFTHENVWTSSDEDLGRREWVKSITEGDSIQIIPLARFRAWRNFVETAEISAICEEALETPISPVARVFSGLSALGQGVYRRLNQQKQEIRLIHVLPGAGEETVCCRMSYISLQDDTATAYECISYCWGSVKEFENIHILPQDPVLSPNAQSPTSPVEPMHVLPVTKNLYTALKHLRYNDKERILWMDALCINQRDLFERGAQVAMMREIFVKSTHTVIWVGESDDETSAILKAAVEVGERFYKNNEDGLVVSTRNDSVSHYLHRVHASIKEVYEDWGALDFTLLQREWFRRTWVIQEVFSAHSAVLQCGDIVVPWSLILRINMCMHRPSAWTTAWRRTVMPDIHDQLFDSRKYKADPLGQEFKHPIRRTMTDILDVLLYGMDLEATDPRDKIFALLGFLDKASNDELEDEIKPDYNKPTWAVFADFTRWWIRTHNSLRILSAIHANAGRTWQDMGTTFNSQTAERPTWSLWHDGRSSWAQATLAGWEFARYSAAPRRFARLLTSDPDVLSIEGCVLGKIESISIFPYFVMDRRLNDLREVYTNLLEPTNARNIWTSSAFQAGKKDESGEHLIIAQDALNDHGDAHADFAQATGGIQCHRPCFISTSEGDRGLCPPMAQRGDLVVILFGGRVPYILRESSIDGTRAENSEPRKQYVFIGECYLQGYMHGLALQQLDNPEHPRSAQVFDII